MVLYWWIGWELQYLRHDGELGVVMVLWWLKGLKWLCWCRHERESLLASWDSNEKT